MARPLWRDRYASPARLLAGLVVPELAIGRGIRTAPPIALFLLEGPPALYQCWIAFEELSGTEDLLTRLARPPVPGDGDLGALLSFVRNMHDRGLEHRDLNLGNLLVRESTAAPWEVSIVDLDRARLSDGGLSFRKRQAALRRLERSYVKSFGDGGPLGARSRSVWYTMYAGKDADLARRLEAGRAAGARWLALHRIAWRLKGEGGMHGLHAG